MHYGEVKAFWSKTTLPTQDTDIGSDGTYPAALGTMGAQAVAYTWTITGSDLNLADNRIGGHYDDDDDFIETPEGTTAIADALRVNASLTYLWYKLRTQTQSPKP